MNRFIWMTSLGILLAAAGLRAQTVTTTGTPATNTIPIFTGPAAISNSNLGLDSYGNLQESGGFFNASTFCNGQYTLQQIDNPATSPISTSGIGNLCSGDLILRSFWGVSIDLNSSGWQAPGGTNGNGSYTRIPGTSSFTINARPYLYDTAHWPTYSTLFTVLNSGKVGIGTTSPSALLEVNGTAQVDGVLTASQGIKLPDGNTQTAAWTGVLCGGDYAESVDVSGDRKHYMAGDVLVIDPDAPGKFLKSADPYSTAVTGIYATKPGVVGRRQTTDYKTNTTEVPMAMVGIVPTRVSAENGPIKPGDFLVTSSTLGYAMKGTDRSRMLGAVVGKSLGKLDSGTGTIEAVVTLQ